MLNAYAWMKASWWSFRRRLEAEDGVIATEYIIMMVLVALAIIAGATALGVAINDKLTNTASDVTAIVP
jgi:Flp pilus assembly pilin Flp